VLKNYFNAAIRHLIHGKLFSAINVLGLAIGLAACSLIALYVHDETSYDRHWNHAERIFRVNTTMDRTGSARGTVNVTSAATLPALRRYFAGEIELGAFTVFKANEIRVGTTRFDETVLEVDRDLIDIFELETLAGSLEAALEEPTGIALSAALAEQLFAGANALDRMLTLVDADGNVADYRVRAVYRLPPGNTVLDLPAMTRRDPTARPYLSNWGILSGPTYVRLAPGVDVADLHSRMASFVDQNIDISSMMAGPDVAPSDRVDFTFQNIADAYLYSPGGGGGNPTMVFAFSAVAALVLLIACFNFMILTTAKATQRAKEVAIRKVIGASRGQLVVQFLGESFLLALVAMLCSLAIVETALPLFESLVDRSLAIPYSDPRVYLYLLGLVGVVGLTSGLYPAFVLSHFRPAWTFKANRLTEAKGSVSLRSALVVFQFAVSIALIIATTVIYVQVRFTVNRDPGFNRENLLVIGNLLRVDNPMSRSNTGGRKETLEQEVAALPEVTSVGLSVHQPGQRFGLATISVPFTLLEGPAGAQQIPVRGVDAGFFRTYETPFIAGRDFADERDVESRLFPWRSFDVAAVAPVAPSMSNVIVNASAARLLGFTDAADAIGRQLRSGDSGFTGLVETATIVGVVADTQFTSLRTEPPPEVYVLSPAFADWLTVRFRGNPQPLLAEIRNLWRDWAGDEPLALSFVDQSLVAQFAGERTEAGVLISFAALAIVVACLGLFGSASFTVDRRTKEIGIRKVFGAEVREVVGLLLWQFSRPVLIANLLAWPAALWALMNWLERFPYRIETWVLAAICLAAGLVALAIAWLTVAGSSLRVAGANPIHALRYE
jgi:putative ABC transport system permease protein